MGEEETYKKEGTPMGLLLGDGVIMHEEPSTGGEP